MLPFVAHCIPCLARPMPAPRPPAPAAPLPLSAAGLGILPPAKRSPRPAGARRPLPRPPPPPPFLTRSISCAAGTTSFHPPAVDRLPSDIFKIIPFFQVSKVNYRDEQRARACTATMPLDLLSVIHCAAVSRQEGLPKETCKEIGLAIHRWRCLLHECNNQPNSAGMPWPGVVDGRSRSTQ